MTGKEQLKLSGPPISIDGFSPLGGQPHLTPLDIPTYMGEKWQYLMSVRGNRSRFAHCPLLDSLFQSEEGEQIRLHLDHTDYELLPEWNEFAWLALGKAFQGASDLFESSKVRFSHVHLPGLVRGQCKIQRTTYLRDVVTTQSLPFKFQCNATGRVVSLNPSPGASDNLSSELGNSFLVITRDRHLIVRYKSRRHRFLSEAWVPFGGIVDFALMDHTHPDTLFELLKRSAMQKVWEQCQIRPSEQTYLVLGLTLDLKYGLKPDVFGLSIVDIDYEEFVDRFEPVYGHRPTSSRIDLSSDEKFQSSVSQAAQEWDGAPFLDGNIALLKGAFSQVRTLVEPGG
ncbi:MAG: hypothetical protein KF884_10940 [Fimbriimonadaceae bacterium]|nr:hypothetical protein [Fimbriimonadaceae bacterium]QYK58063.1 MAG: hypothetical protein KF884_10940 [Fimbriimonadaceae bacterium]